MKANDALQADRGNCRRDACTMMLASIAIAIAITLASPPAARAADLAVTYHRDIAPIMAAHCAACHREGEAAPFALQSYEQVSRRAKHIVDLTSRRVMPPWKPIAGHGEFIGARRLSDAEIDTLAKWHAAGAPEGDRPAAQAAKPREFIDGWQLGEPDMVVRMTEAFTVPADGKDIYRCFVVPLGLPPGKYIRAAEYRPGNRRVVHHAVLTTMPADQARRKLASEPAGAGPGFASGLVAPGTRLPGAAGIWVPGWEAMPLPEGCQVRPAADSVLILQLHLHSSGKPETEQSSVGLFLTDQPPTRELKPFVLMNKEVDIAPGDRSYALTKAKELPSDADLIGVFPHMHLLGRTVDLKATLPDGTAVPLLRIDDWDFRWQGYYQYAKPVRLPKGTRIEARWTFDNSAENPAQPSQPPKRVRFGEQTADEMGAVMLDLIAR